MKTKIALFLFLICSLFCTSFSWGQKYHKANYKRMGYSETQLSPDKFNVTYRWHGIWTNKAEKINDFYLLRCAELTLMNGYKYFKIIEGKESDDHHNGVTSTTVVEDINKTIRLLKDKPENDDYVYDAAFLQKSVREKYNL